jgi:hypothetical protein
LCPIDANNEHTWGFGLAMRLAERSLKKQL